MSNRRAPALYLSAVMFLMLASSARASTNYVTNGNFEIVTSGHTASFSLEAPTSNENAVTGWTLGNTSPLTSSQVLNCLVMGGTNTNVCGTVEFGGGFSYWVNPGESPSPDGGNYYAADGDSSATDNGTSPTGGTAGGYSVPIYQTVNNLIAGDTYVLSFQQAAAQQGNRTGATTEQWEVEFCTTLPSVACTGNNLQYSQLMNNASHGDVPWQGQTMTFTASAASQVLEFLALGAPNGEPPFVLLDGVSLQQTPEPGTCALFGLGLLAISLAGKLLRKRH